MGLKVTKKKLPDHLGVSLKTIKEAHKKGRIKGEKNANGHWEFDVEECRKMFDATSTRDQIPGYKQKPRIGDPDYGIEDEEIPKTNKDGEDWEIADARLHRETFLAKQAELDYKEKSKQLISAEEVRKEFEDIAIKVQKGVMAVPPRLRAILAAEADEFKVEQLLVKELRHALSSIADGLKLVSP